MVAGDEAVEAKIREILGLYENDVSSGSNVYTIGSVLEGLSRHFEDKSFLTPQRRNFVSRTIQKVFNEMAKSDAEAKVAAKPFIPENDKELEKIFQKKRSRSNSIQVDSPVCPKIPKVVVSSKLSLPANFVDFIGEQFSTREAVVRKIVDHIKVHCLQDQIDKRIIHCDLKLSRLLGSKKSTLFGICKFLRMSLPQKVPSKGTPGVQTLLVISDELEDMLQVQMMARSEVLKLLWRYIKLKGLQRSDEKKIIKCGQDASMLKVFQKEIVNMNEMNGMLSDHVEKIDSEEKAMDALFYESCKSTIENSFLYRTDQNALIAKLGWIRDIKTEPQYHQP